MEISKKPKISLIICSRNRAMQLKRCLEKIPVEEMVSANGELILVNNASNDNTQEIMISFKESTPFPVTIVHGYVRGKSHALNRGISAVRGDIVIFTDDDCYLHEGYLLKVREIFESREFDFCGGQSWMYNTNDAVISDAYYNKKYIFAPFSFIPAGSFMGLNMVFHRRVIEKVGLFDTMLGPGTHLVCEDIDYAARASWAGFTGAFIPDLIVYHHHGRKTIQDIIQITKSYDYGRGAYYMKFILKGKLIYLLYWYKMYRVTYLRDLFGDRHTKLSIRFMREITGAIKYLFARIRKSIVYLFRIENHYLKGVICVMNDIILPPHGGCGLINRIVPEYERDSFIQGALKFKTYTISNAGLSIFYRIADGALSPLEGPMDSREFHRVLDEEIIERNDRKYAWTIPLAFPIFKKDIETFHVGETIAVKNEEGAIVGVLEISDIYHFDKAKYNKVVYGTDREDHPGPRIVNNYPRDYLLGGKIWALPQIKNPLYGKYMLTPQETRSLFIERKWERIIAFQTRNVLHRAHEYVMVYALEKLAKEGIFAGVVLNPLVGATKPNDVPADVRMITYEVLLIRA